MVGRASRWPWAANWACSDRSNRVFRSQGYIRCWYEESFRTDQWLDLRGNRKSGDCCHTLNCVHLDHKRNRVYPLLSFSTMQGFVYISAYRSAANNILTRVDATKRKHFTKQFVRAHFKGPAAIVLLQVSPVLRNSCPQKPLSDASRLAVERFVVCEAYTVKKP